MRRWGLEMQQLGACGGGGVKTAGWAHGRHLQPSPPFFPWSAGHTPSPLPPHFLFAGQRLILCPPGRQYMTTV